MERKQAFRKEDRRFELWLKAEMKIESIPRAVNVDYTNETHWTDYLYHWEGVGRLFHKRALLASPFLFSTEQRGVELPLWDCIATPYTPSRNSMMLAGLNRLRPRKLFTFVCTGIESQWNEVEYDEPVPVLRLGNANYAAFHKAGLILPHKQPLVKKTRKAA